MPLPLVKRGTAGSNSLPTSDSLYKCMELATKPESANYFHTQFERKLTEGGLKDKAQAALTEVKKFADFIALNVNASSNLWSGDIRIPSGFQNYQEQLASQAINDISVNNITFDYAISDNAEFLRGYASDGKPLDKEALASMDKIFNAWLVENDMICKEGVIYEATDKGEIKRDADNKPIRADAEELRSQIKDKGKGFESYLSKKKEDIQLNVREQTHPAQRIEADKAAEKGYSA